MMKDDERNIQFVALKMEFLILCNWDLAGVTYIRCHRTSFPKLQLLLSSLFYNSTSASTEIIAIFSCNPSQIPRCLC